MRGLPLMPLRVRIMCTPGKASFNGLAEWRP